MSGDAPVADETINETVNEESAGPGDPPVLKEQALSVFQEEAEAYVEAGGSEEDILQANADDNDDSGEETVSEPEPSGTETQPADAEDPPTTSTPEPEPEPEPVEAKTDPTPEPEPVDDWKWLGMDELASRHPKPSFDPDALDGEAKDVHEYWLKTFNVRCAQEGREKKAIREEFGDVDLDDLREKAQTIDDINNPDVREYDAIRNLVRQDYRYREMGEAFLNPQHPEHDRVVRTYQLGMTARDEQGGLDDEPITRADLQQALADQRDALSRQPSAPSSNGNQFTDWAATQGVPEAEFESFVTLHKRNKVAGQGPIPGREPSYWAGLWSQIKAERDQDQRTIEPPQPAVASPEVRENVDTLRRHIPDAEPKPRRVGGGRRERPDINNLDANEIFELVRQGKINPDDYPEIGGAY